ncbi:MAG TPA: RNA polymerase sigma factor [Nocardioidaceae bacterium]|nr:RNA polymerase sigma factor [Nocardioidaceae bacterium]
MSVPPADLERVFRAEYGRVVAGLVRRFGDIDLAEDALSDAMVTALEKWPVDGVPPNPAAWLTTVAGNRAVDRLRRAKVGQDKHAEAAITMERQGPVEPEETGPVDDDRLRLIFTCCHPALAMENRVALTLRLLGGLTVAEIAHAFLVPETTMAQRLTRAKSKIKNARIPYRVPLEGDLPERLTAVTAVLYLVFNEGYLATGPDSAPVREELCAEAIRLARLLRSLVTDPELDGLLALMLLLEARREARVSDGVLVTLPDQDRSRWDAALIDEGHALVRACLATNRPGPYQLQAAINAVHTDALEASMTDWSQIVQLYDQLVQVAPSPVVALNRAVAVAELDGPEVALALVDRPDVAEPLSSYHAFHATRADLLRRLGRRDDARSAYGRAIELAGNEAERAWLRRRLDEPGD